MVKQVHATPCLLCRARRLWLPQVSMLPFVMLCKALKPAVQSDMEMRRSEAQHRQVHYGARRKVLLFRWGQFRSASSDGVYLIGTTGALQRQINPLSFAIIDCLCLGQGHCCHHGDPRAQVCSKDALVQTLACSANSKCQALAARLQPRWRSIFSACGNLLGMLTR